MMDEEKKEKISDHEDLDEEVDQLSGEEAEEELGDEDLMEDEEDVVEGFAFPMAPIVRLMKDELDNDKMIRRRVKEGMNKWLEAMCRRISVKMNESEYTMVEVDDFKTAIEPYEMVEATEQERERIVASLEKIKQDCDSLIMDVERKFISP